MTAIATEYHPFTPFLPANSQILMLGSFPPSEKRWSMHFYYPNFTNDMWRIFGHIFFRDKDRFVDLPNKTFHLDKLKVFLEAIGVALYDTATAVRRTTGTASDKDLEIVQPTDINALLAQIPQCRAIVTAGQLATDTLRAYFNIEQVPGMGQYADFIHPTFHTPMRLYRMPSSSRAYPMKLEKKAEHYERMLREILERHLFPSLE